LAERVRLGDGLISSNMERFIILDIAKGRDNDTDDDDDDESGRASENLLGVKVAGKHSNKDIVIEFTGAAISDTGDYQTWGKVKRVREISSSAVGDGYIIRRADGKDSTPGVVSSIFGGGKTVYFAFDLAQSSIPENVEPTKRILKSALLRTTPTSEVFIPTGRVGIGINVASNILSFELSIRVEESVPQDADIVNRIDGTKAGNTLIWNEELNLSESRTFNYLLGLPDIDLANVATTADVSYLFDGNYLLQESVDLTIAAGNDLASLLDRTILQLNALVVSGSGPRRKVDMALEDLNTQRSVPPVTDRDIEDAIQEILKIIRDLTGLAITSVELSDIRDNLDRVLMIYGTRLSN